MSVDTSRIEALVLASAEERAVELAEEFIETVRSTMPRRTGDLADSVEIDRVDVTRERVTVRIIVSAPYARYVNDGTGIYGPEGEPIRPLRPNGVLAFDWPAAGGLVFARHVRGSEPTHFWERALDRWPGIVRAA